MGGCSIGIYPYQVWLYPSVILPVALCLFQLSGVERYAVHFVESTQNFVTEEELEIDEVVFISTSRALQSIFIPISLSTLTWS